MGKRTIVLAIALTLAAVSAFSVFRYLNTIEDDVRRDIVEVEIFRALEPMDTGTPGEQAQLLIEPSRALLEAVVFDGSRILCTGPVDRATQDVDPAVCQDNPSDLASLLAGTVAAGPISQGQLITLDQFISPIELNDVKLSESIPQGKVAIAINPSDVGSVGGFVRPGDNVNIVSSSSINLASSVELLKDPELRELLLGAGFGFNVDESATTAEGEEEQLDPVTRFLETLPGELEFTQTVMQNLEVLAVGADTRPSPLGSGLLPQGSQIVVLEVTPEQAEKIEWIDQFTSIKLSLLPSEFPYTEFEARGILIDDVFDLITRIQEQLEAVVFGS